MVFVFVAALPPQYMAAALLLLVVRCMLVGRRLQGQLQEVGVLLQVVELRMLAGRWLSVLLLVLRLALLLVLRSVLALAQTLVGAQEQQEQRQMYVLLLLALVS